MKRRIAFGTLLAVMLVFGVTVTAMAAGPGPNAVAVPGTGIAGQGAALNGTFIDEDGDGVCDTYGTGVPAQDGTGGWWGNGSQPDATTPGAGFVDNDGDGVCDDCTPIGTNPQDGTGRQIQRGGRWGW